MEIKLEVQIILIEALFYDINKAAEKTQKLYESKITNIKTIMAQLMAKMGKFSPKKME